MSLTEESNQASEELLPTAAIGGYKNPPKAAQFKPGQSGNPKGRPKGSTSTAMLLQKALAKSVTILENGKTKKITRGEAMMHTITAKAVKGDFKFAKLALELKDRYKLNNEITPLTNIVVTFKDPDSETLAAHKREDEFFEQLEREKQRLVVRDIKHTKSDE